MTFSEVLGTLIAVSSLVGGLWYGIATFARAIWRINQYLATIVEATKYQNNKLEELVSSDRELEAIVDENTRHIAEIQNFLEILTRDTDRAFIRRK